MQDRYAGDVGDFGKFALLRAVAPGRRLGVCWYRCDGAGETNNDGKHIAYLESGAERFRPRDPQVFDALRELVKGPRNVRELEKLGLLAGAVYHGARVPSARAERETWFEELQRTVEGCDLVFGDMDNGFEWSTLSPKCIARVEARELMKGGRAVLLYHHQTRRKGGAKADYRHFVKWLFEAGARTVEGVRLSPYTSRFYLLANGDRALSGALQTFVEKWSPDAELFRRAVAP
jgi:hypothetical protein